MVNRFVLPRLPRATLGALVTMAVLTLGAQNAHAQSSSWNGGTGDWSVPGNWTPTGVPNSPTTDVSITGTSSIPSSVALDNLSPTVHNLSLDSFSTLSISAKIFTSPDRASTMRVRSTSGPPASSPPSLSTPRPLPSLVAAQSTSTTPVPSSTPPAARTPW